jgi:hypothetical protein
MAIKVQALLARAKPSKIENLPIDAVITQTISMENEVTDHPVEEGFNVTDHSRPLPDKLTMECIISNTPVSADQQQRIVQSGSYQITTTAPNPTDASAYSDNALKKIEALRTQGAVFTVVTRRRTYDTMTIESIQIVDDAKTVDMLKFSISLKRIRVVKNKQTRLTVSKDPRAGGKVSTGHQVNKDGEGKETSALLDIAKATGIKSLLGPGA